MIASKLRVVLQIAEKMDCDEILDQLFKEETVPAAETQSDGADAKKRERLAALAAGRSSTISLKTSSSLIRVPGMVTRMFCFLLSAIFGNCSLCLLKSNIWALSRTALRLARSCHRAATAPQTGPTQGSLEEIYASPRIGPCLV